MQSFDVIIGGSRDGSPSNPLVYWDIIYHAAQMSTYNLPICQGLYLHSQRDFNVDSGLTPSQSFCVVVCLFYYLVYHEKYLKKINLNNFCRGISGFFFLFLEVL